MNAKPKTATFIRRLEGFQGDARLYRVDPPVERIDWSSGEEKQTLHDYVVVSAVVAMFSGPETYIFPASADGEVVDWLELNGSFRGGLDHGSALGQAGYAITGED
jgi:hypothetical protein